jgi:hypothetical protein
MDALLESGQLRKAIHHMKAHPTLDITKETWRRIFEAIEVRTSEAEENTVNTRALAEYPPISPARMDMTDMYRTLRDQQHLRLFGAVDGPLAGGSHQVTPTMLETITNLSIKALTPQPTPTLLIAGVALALLEGVVSAALGWNFNALVLSTCVLALLDRLLCNGAVSESFLKVFSPGISEKIVRHEAGHFLCAYLLGCPVEGCVLSAWAALSDARFDGRSVSAGTSFFDPSLSREMNSGRVTQSSLDRYSVIVMAGIAAEAAHFGRADGGAGDEMALVAFLSQLNGKGNRNVWNDVTIRNQARWGALQAVLMLREYKPAYDALVDALERGGKLGDCIHAIERAGREHNLEPLSRPVGYILEQGLYGEWTTEMPADVVTTTAAAVSQERPITEMESFDKLSEYRTQVEERLREIDARIKEIEDV